jgi:hypothetical protein
VADDLEVRDVSSVDVAEDRSIAMTMLFDEGHSLGGDEYSSTPPHPLRHALRARHLPAKRGRKARFTHP